MQSSFFPELIKTVLLIVGLFFAARWFGGFGVGAPLVPLKKRDWQDGMALAEVKPGELVIDLGSGDGRLLVETAKRGARVVGYEINPFMVWYAKRRLRVFGENAHVYGENLFNADISQADVIFIFQISTLMAKIGEKLKMECKPGARVITYAFGLPGKTLEKEQGIAKLYRF